MNLNSRPLLPHSYFADMKGWNLEYTEIPNTIIKRWNLPAAQLVNLTGDCIRQLYCVDLSGSEIDLNEILNEDCISYSVISAIRYLTDNNYSICITTCLMSNKAASLSYRIHGQKLLLADGREASIFSFLNPYTPLQITYLDNDNEGRRYIVTIDIDVDVVENDGFENRPTRVLFSSGDSSTGEINQNSDMEGESVIPKSLDDAIAYLKNADTPYIYAPDRYPYIEKLLGIIQNNIALV